MMDDNCRLINFLLRLADTNLVLGHRLSEWCGHAPELEPDIAIANIALDLVGQARYYYQYAARLENKGRTEDDLAYLRDARDYRNLLLVEQPNGDFGQTVTRQFFYDVYHFYFLQALQQSSDEELAAIAGKSLKEATYHLRWSAGYMIRLGDGTATSRVKMQAAVERLWRYTGELTTADETDRYLSAQGLVPDPQTLRRPWEEHVRKVLAEATLELPAEGWMQQGGKQGLHTEHLGYLLAEMQFLQRAYPGLAW